MPKADPRALGVKWHIQFPSGAVLVKCNNEEQANKLREIACSSGFQEKKQTFKQLELQIYNVPITTTSEQIAEDVEKHFGERPQEENSSRTAHPTSPMSPLRPSHALWNCNKN